MAFDPETLPVPDLGVCCPGCGYNLAGLPEHRCPECGRQFTMEEFIPEGQYPVVIFNREEVRSSPQVIELLTRMKVPYMEVMRPGDVVYGVGSPIGKWARIAVPRACFFEVIDLLRRMAMSEPMPEPSAERQSEQGWTCTACGEENPGNFEICWNCGESTGS